MPDARITQAVVEILQSGSPDARITHAVAEVLFSQASKARTTQLHVEILSSELSKARTSQIHVEVLERMTTTTTETTSSTTTSTSPPQVEVSKGLSYAVLSVPDGALTSKGLSYAVLEVTTTTTTIPYAQVSKGLGFAVVSPPEGAIAIKGLGFAVLEPTTTSSTTTSSSSTVTSTTIDYTTCSEFSDGFESGDLSEWQGSDGGATVTSSDPYLGTYCADLSAISARMWKNFTSSDEIYISFRWKPAAGWTGAVGSALAFRNTSSGVDQNMLFLYANNNDIYWYRGDATKLGQTTSHPLHSGWNKFEIYLKVANAPNGIVVIRHDDVEVLHLSGVDTLQSYTVLNQVVFGEGGTFSNDHAYCYIDNVCISNTYWPEYPETSSTSSSSTSSTASTTSTHSTTSSTASSTSTFSTTSSSSTTSSTASSSSTSSTASTTSSTSSTASSSSTSSTASSSSTTTTPPPEYWNTDFREMTVDAVPGGWTEEWHPTSGVSTIRDDGQIGNNCLEIVCSDERYGLSWDEVGLQDDPEILVKVRARASVDVVGYAVLRGGGTGDGDEQAYYSCLYANSDRVYIRKYVAGSSLTIAWSSYTVDINTWYWMRFRILGSDLKLKIWADGEAEPGSWTIEVSDTDIVGDGWVGVGTFYNGPDYDYIAVASNGGTALLPSLTTTTSTVSTTTSTTHTYTGSTTTMSSTSSTSSTASTTSSSSSTASTTSTFSTTSSSSSTTTTTYPPCFWNDDFTGTDYDPPNRLRWTDDSIGTGLAYIIDNTLDLVNGGGGTNTGILTCNGVFSGDFIVTVDLEALIAPFENSWSARLQALIDSSNYIWIDMHFEELVDTWTVGYRKAAPEKYPDSDSRTNDYGSLRIVRIGSVFYTYYRDGAGSWTELNPGGQNIGTGDVTISLQCVSWEIAANFEIAWDDFTVDYDGCPESVTTTTSSTTSSSTTTVTQSTTSSTASTTSSTASTTGTSSSTASTTSTRSTTSSTVSTVSSSSTTESFTTTTWSGTTTTLPPPPDTQTTTMVVVTTG